MHNGLRIIKKRDYSRILVIKTRHLGDVLLNTPVFAVLREQFPSSEIVGFVRRGTENILEGNPHLNAVWSYAGSLRPGRFGKLLDDLRVLTRVRRKCFDLVIDLTKSDRSALVTRLSGAPKRLGYASAKGFLGRSRCYTDSLEGKVDEHIVRKHLRLLEPLGISSPDHPLVFPLCAADRSAVQAVLPFQGEFFQVHPVSRITKKNWPVKYMADLIRSLSRNGLTPVITGSSDPIEQEWIRELRSQTKLPHLDLSGKLNLKQLGALSERAKFFVGIDTAPMHIAAAVGTPVIALFGPSSERLWGPWCDKKLVLSRELSCRLPCKNKHGCEHIECLREMTPEMVRGAVMRFLGTI